jgi:hypothetical protein
MRKPWHCNVRLFWLKIKVIARLYLLRITYPDIAITIFGAQQIPVGVLVADIAFGGRLLGCFVLSCEASYK